MGKFLVTGALGQVGSELVPALRRRYGADRIVASDIRMPHRASDSGESSPECAWWEEGPYELVDVCHDRHVQEVVARHGIERIYHLAALLSAVAEQKPQVAWQVNVSGLYRVLEVARQTGCSVFVPSSIGAFGPTTPPDHTPQDTAQRPTTMYGVSKVTGELLCDYYAHRFGVDTRGVRFPGLISYVAPPGGGTTDYAVEIFYQALRYQHYTCFLAPETQLDMMYMPDAIDAIIDLMEADPTRLVHRNAFNITSMHFTPTDLAAAIRHHLPAFEIDYDVDPVRQRIADSWPNSLDDSAARTEWDWNPKWNLETMTADMLDKLGARLQTRG